LDQFQATKGQNPDNFFDLSVDSFQNSKIGGQYCIAVVKGVGRNAFLDTVHLASSFFSTTADILLVLLVSTE
jgi:hypothetical protein